MQNTPPSAPAFPALFLPRFEARTAAFLSKIAQLAAALAQWNEAIRQHASSKQLRTIACQACLLHRQLESERVTLTRWVEEQCQDTGIQTIMAHQRERGVWPLPAIPTLPPILRLVGQQKGKGRQSHV